MPTPFTINKADLEFFLRQIKIAEAHASGVTLTQAIQDEYGLDATDAALAPFGLRTVDGSLNNLLPGQEDFGAADTPFPRLLDPAYVNDTDGDSIDLDGPGPGGPLVQGDYAAPGDVVDADPRTISNLIVNQTIDNPAAVGAWFANPLSLDKFAEDHPLDAMDPAAGSFIPVRPGELTDPATQLEVSNEDLANIFNQSPDIGLSPGFNAWMTFFGQFFDHGLDLVTKSDNGTVYIPLADDDPLRTHGLDGIEGNGDEVPDHLAFMALTRAKVDANGDAENTTTPHVDQNQTYTSHASHQVFLREYERIDTDGDGVLDLTVSTGKLLEGSAATGGVDGAPANWAETKAQALELLGINLSDFDVHSAPLLLTDQYGEFIPGPNGYAQLAMEPDAMHPMAWAKEGNPDGSVTTAGAYTTGHQFLVDIAHHAAPGRWDSNGDHVIDENDAFQTPDLDVGDPSMVADDGDPSTYDNEMLDSHFLTGDGRGNENIALTVVHSVFHSEHNRLVDANKETIIEAALEGDIAFLNEWLLVDVAAVPADLDDLVWDGERLFQAARIPTEMQYQHLVFEEFARAIAPNIDPFVFTNDAQIDPSIIAEFAHTVYRFGHSMLNDTVDRLENDLTTVDVGGVDSEQATLIEAFLNPQMYTASGADVGEIIGNLARGLSRDVGNEIDEFVVPALQTNLLGLPLDLAAINIARGRENGIPSLNETRAQLYEDFGLADLKAYTSWLDFAQHLKHPESIINFIAAYGTHETIVAEDTLAGKRAAAAELLGFEQATTVDVAIANNSFEDDSLADDGAGPVFENPLGNFTIGSPTGWTITGTGGLFAPVDTVSNPAGHDGGNVAWLSGGATLSQDSGEVLAEGSSYQLTLNVGDRTDQVWTGGEVRLVDSNGVVLASAALPEPADGEWEAVTFDTGPIAALSDGLNLHIEVENTGGSQILIDNVGVQTTAPFSGAGVPADAAAFLNATGDYAGGDLGGLNLVDLWIGGLAEELNEFGSMLGSTFSFIFEYQLEHLQTGDRFYYLSRTQGTNLLNQLEPNTFTDLIMRNSELGDDYATHLSHAIFQTPDHIFELDSGIAQTDYNLDNPDSQADGGYDPVHDDPFLQAIDPKVVRETSGVQVVDPETGIMHDVGGTLKYSGGEHVVLGGTEGDDRLFGDKGIDSLWGDGGNDYLNAGMESDHVFGGEGDDIIEDPFGDDFLRGEGGNDVISAGQGLDLAFGGDGVDYLIMGQDDGEAFGDEGDDFILGGTSNDFLLGGEGNDWIEGGDGFDVIAGENSELFFNSPIIGHDILWGQGGDQDYDAESGDDIMISGPGIQRFEGMLGFDWAIAKYDPIGANYDFQIPIFTNIPTDILRDRFDLTEAASGWMHNDVLDGDDRGHSGGSSSPDAAPEASFIGHVLDEEGIDRIDGLRDFLGGDDFGGPIKGLETLFGEGTTSYRDGNILMGGGGDDFLRGRGGYDIIDGDAWLNVHINIHENADGTGAVIGTVESLTTDTLIAGPMAGKVIGGFGELLYDGASLNSLMLNGTINPGQLKAVREILEDDAHYDSMGVADRAAIDTAIFQGNLAEYDIEGRDIEEGGTTQAADLDGDGFIRVQDRDNGVIGAVVDGVQLNSRGALTDDTDLLRNIEQLQFADQTIMIGGTNNFATGTVTISDETPFDIDGDGPAPAMVTPYVGQVLTATLTDFEDLDGIPLDANGLPVGLTFEWQTTEIGSNAGWSTIESGLDYTVRPVDPGHVLRAVAVFEDSNGVVERINSASTEGPTAPFTINENSADGTIVALEIPFSVDYDPLPLGGNAPVDVDITTLVHVINPDHDAGGRFDVILNGVDSNGFPRYSLVVAADAPPLDYDNQDAFQIVDNEYPVVIDTYSDTIANGGVLVASRQFTVILSDVPDPTDIQWNGVAPAGNALPLAGMVIADLSATDPDSAAMDLTYSSTSTEFSVSPTGEVAPIAALTNNQSYALDVDVTDAEGNVYSETFNVHTGQNGGGASVDNLVGDANSDIMYARGGADTLTGNGGNDTLYGQNGNDWLNGGDGNDILDGGAGGADRAVFSGPFSNYQFALDGTGGIVVTDTVGNDGTDTLVNIERMVFDGGTVQNTIVAGTNGVDNLASAGGRQVVLGFDDDDTLNSGNGADLLNGGGGDDTINAGGGNDTIVWSVGGGNDTVDGGGGGDDTMVINGDAGAEVFDIVGDAGGTGLITVSRNGTLISTIDNVEELVVNGNGGGDTFNISGDFTGTALNYSTITIHGSEDDDMVDISELASDHRFVFHANGGDDHVMGDQRPQDELDTSNGGTVTYMDGSTDDDEDDQQGGGSDDGQDGHDDTPTDEPENQAPSIELTNVVPFMRHMRKSDGPVKVADIIVHDDDRGTNKLKLTGTDAGMFQIAAFGLAWELQMMPQTGFEFWDDDHVFSVNVEVDDESMGSSSEGSANFEIQVGNQRGHGPNDHSHHDWHENSHRGSNGDAAHGDDTDGAIDDDMLDDTAEYDASSGGHGNNYHNGRAGDDDCVGGDGGDALKGGSDNDELFGGNSDDVLFGGSGDDMLYGGAGDDTLNGGSGDDMLLGEAGDDTLNGGSGDDVLDGGEDDDVLNGGSGDDVLEGGSGDDMLNGGSGDDTFVFAENFGNDTIIGFDADFAGGQDLLDFRGYGIHSADDFAANVTIEVADTDTVVTVNVDTLTLVGVNGVGGNAITEDDFYLA